MPLQGGQGTSGSRSAATSPVGGSTLSLAGDAAAGGKRDGGSANSSPRHSFSGAPGSANGAAASSARATSNDAKVEPSDRVLAMRAKLHSGWSARTAHLNQWKQPDPISTEEHDMILKVIEKAEALERAEQQRVG